MTSRGWLQLYKSLLKHDPSFHYTFEYRKHLISFFVSVDTIKAISQNMMFHQLSLPVTHFKGSQELLPVPGDIYCTT